MGDGWTIEFRGKSWSVLPFRSDATALAHSRDHYLEWREAWEQVDASAAELRRQHDQATDETARAQVVAKARIRYEAAVRRQTGPGRLDAADELPYQGHRSLMVATDTGIFAAFGERLSDLYTAYRPFPGVFRGSLTVQQFRDNARRKLARF